MVIEATRSALVIIDMQSEFCFALDFEGVDIDSDFFLHPGLSPEATAGRGVVNATVDMIQGFRKAGMKVLWTNVRFSFFFLWFQIADA